MHRRSFVAATAVAALTTSLTVATANVGFADHTADITNGPLLSESKDVGTTIQQLDHLDGSPSKQLPGRAADPAEFSPDGTKIAYAASNGGVRVRHTDWTLHGFGQPLPDEWIPDEVRWGHDGSYVVVDAIDELGNAWSLWRVPASGAPVKLVQTDSQSTPSFDTDPHTDLVAYIDDGDVHTVDALMPAQKQALTNNCHRDEGFRECGSVQIFEVSWSPTLDRMLVRYSHDEDGEQLGWLPETGAALTPAQVVTDYATRPMVSPDGAAYAWNDDRVVDDGEGGRELIPVSRWKHGGAGGTLEGAHWSWQPCPGGTCPVFQRPAPPPRAAPSAPPIGIAVAGARGRPVNAKAAWKAAANPGTAPITAYQVEAQKLNARGKVVKRVKATTGPAARSKTMGLALGRYKFRVRAKNSVGFSPWSASSKVVRAR